MFCAHAAVDGDDRALGADQGGDGSRPRRRCRRRSWVFSAHMDCVGVVRSCPCPACRRPRPVTVTGPSGLAACMYMIDVRDSARPSRSARRRRRCALVVKAPPRPGMERWARKEHVDVDRPRPACRRLMNFLMRLTAVVEAVDHADVQDACRSRAATLLHLQRLGVGAARRAFRTERPCRRASTSMEMVVDGMLLGVQTDTALDLGVVQGDRDSR